MVKSERGKREAGFHGRDAEGAEDLEREYDLGMMRVQSRSVRLAPLLAALVLAATLLPAPRAADACTCLLSPDPSEQVSVHLEYTDVYVLGSITSWSQGEFTMAVERVYKGEAGERIRVAADGACGTKYEPGYRALVALRKQDGDVLREQGCGSFEFGPDPSAMEDEYVAALARIAPARPPDTDSDARDLVWVGGALAVAAAGAAVMFLVRRRAAA